MGTKAPSVKGAAGTAAGGVVSSGSENSISINPGSGHLAEFAYVADENINELCLDIINITGSYTSDINNNTYTKLNPVTGGCAAMIGAAGGSVKSQTVDAEIDIPPGALQAEETIGVGEVTEKLPDAIINTTGVDIEAIVAFTP